MFGEPDPSPASAACRSDRCCRGSRRGSRRARVPSSWRSSNQRDDRRCQPLTGAEDSANTEYLARVGQIQNLLTQIGEAFAFVIPEIQAIDDDTFANQALIKDEQGRALLDMTQDRRRKK